MGWVTVAVEDVEGVDYHGGVTFSAVWPFIEVCVEVLTKPS